MRSPVPLFPFSVARWFDKMILKVFIHVKCILTSSGGFWFLTSKGRQEISVSLGAESGQLMAWRLLSTHDMLTSPLPMRWAHVSALSHVGWPCPVPQCQETWRLLGTVEKKVALSRRRPFVTPDSFLERLGCPGLSVPYWQPI